MNYGFVLPSGDARTAAEYAQVAEQAGWDGFFVWEPVYGWDAWVMLAAAAMRTERIRLGTMITPVSRMRPWKLAGEALTLDHLSRGRVNLTVGLGAIDVGFAEFGEETDRRTRAELLDESLEIITALWRGQPFAHIGKHYNVDGGHLHQPPLPSLQQPRIPIWVVGAWPGLQEDGRPRPSNPSMARAIAYDGIVPSARDDDGNFRQVNPTELAAMRDWIGERRDLSSFDIVVEGTTSTTDRERAVAKVRPWADAGATWFLEARWAAPEDEPTPDSLRRRLEAGPPRID